MSAKDFARTVRDRLYRVAYQRVGGRNVVEQVGVTLAVDHPEVSDRMYYVMSKDYESRDALLAATVLTADSQVLELGSSSGFMAIYCRKVLGVRSYAMVEANPALDSLIAKNFRLNGLDLKDTPLIGAAAAAEDGAVDLHVHENIWSSGIVNRGGKTLRVPTRSIPSILSELPFAPDTLIMDIEGSELAIPPSHFAPFRHLVIEMHPKLFHDGRERTARLLGDLESLGFGVKEKAGDSYVMARGTIWSGDPVDPNIQR
ncbi:MAG: FkbM family methyltransferase [Pseudomonadota bacterium]